MARFDETAAGAAFRKAPANSLFGRIDSLFRLHREFARKLLEYHLFF